MAMMVMVKLERKMRKMKVKVMNSPRMT